MGHCVGNQGHPRQKSHRGWHICAPCQYSSDSPNPDWGKWQGLMADQGSGCGRIDSGRTREDDDAQTWSICVDRAAAEYQPVVVGDAAWRVRCSCSSNHDGWEIFASQTRDWIYPPPIISTSLEPSNPRLLVHLSARCASSDRLCSTAFVFCAENLRC